MRMSKALLLAGLGTVVATAGVVATHAVAGDGWGKRGHHGWGHHGRYGGGKLRRMRRMDADKNGEITMEELEEARAERFEQLDQDGDGAVTREELIERAKARVMERIERRTTRRMRRLDADRDGKVTPEEFNRHAKERFVWADLNDDGKLSGDELPGRRWKRGGRKGGDDNERQRD